MRLNFDKVIIILFIKLYVSELVESGENNLHCLGSWLSTQVRLRLLRIFSILASMN